MVTECLPWINSKRFLHIENNANLQSFGISFVLTLRMFNYPY